MFVAAYQKQAVRGVFDDEEITDFIGTGRFDGCQYQWLQ